MPDAREAMEYPKDFPVKAEARVEIEKMLAERMFDASKAIFIRDYERDKDRRFVTALLIDCILRVFAAFGKEACDLGKSGAWTASVVDGHAREFLRKLVREFARERGYDNFGNALPDLLSDGDVSLEFENSLRQSNAWLDFQKARHWVAVRQALPQSIGSVDSSPKPAIHAKEIQASPGQEIEQLRQECDLTIEELAGQLEIDPTNVARHIRGESTPSRMNRRKYECVFSKLLKRNISISKTQPKRS
jgi:DNA-binding transcriptional regulator YiaG